MLAGLVFQNQQLKICSAKRDDLIHQIEQLELQSKETMARAITSKEQAELTVKSSKKDVQRIMSTSVPNDCLKSIEWGIQQAKIIG